MQNDDKLNPCPFCKSEAEKRGGYDWGKVGCSSWECLIRSIAFYPEQWNTRAIDIEAVIGEMEALKWPLTKEDDITAMNVNGMLDRCLEILKRHAKIGGGECRGRDNEVSFVIRILEGEAQ